MLSKHKYLHVKNEEGSGLILALMTLMVLSVLGASLGAITIGSFKLGDINRDDTSAYYIAEAGANMAYEELKSGVLDSYEANDSESLFFDSSNGVKGVTDTLNGKIYSNEYFDSQFGDQPKATIKISKVAGTNPREYIIESTGEIAGKIRTVEKPTEVNWIDKNSGSVLPKLPKNAAIIGNSNINISGNELIGNIIINSAVNDSVNLTYTNISKAIFLHRAGLNPALLIDYPDWNKPITQVMQESIDWESYNLLVTEFPDFPLYPVLQGNENISLNGGVAPTVINLEKNTAFRKIELNSERVLRINTGSNDISITVDNLLLNNGHVEVLGTGSLTIHVKNSMVFGSSSTINRNSDSAKVSIYYEGSSSLNFSGSQRVNGSLFIKKADLNVQNGSGINGVIVSGGKKVLLDGGTFASPLIIAPKALVDIGAGANYNGVIVGEKINLSGGAIVKYKEYDINDYPFASNGSDVDAGNEDTLTSIISTKPSLEME